MATPSPATRSLSNVARVSLLAVLGMLYGLGAMVGLIAAIHRGVVSPLWPAAGLGLWIAWRFGTRSALVVGLALLVVLFPAGLDPVAWIGLSAASVVEAVLGAALLRRARFDPALGHISDVLMLTVLVAILSTLLAAAIGVSALCVAGDAPWSGFAPLFGVWWVGDALGCLLVGAVLFTRSAASVPRRGGSRREFAALVVLSAVVAWIAFVPGPVGHEVSLVVKFSVFPLIAWSALRFRQRDTAAISMIIGIVASYATLRGQQDFGGRASTEALIVVQFFIAVMTITGLVMGAVTASRRRTEGQLQSAASLMEATLDSTADGILVVDMHGSIRTFNRRFAELWQIPGEVLATRDDRAALAHAVAHLKEPAGFMRKVESLYAQPEAESFDAIELKDGRTFERLSVPQREYGVIVGRVWSFRDVTQQRRLESELRQAHKMEAVGRLAGGVAHDFNNLLTVILGHADLLSSQRSHDASTSADLTEIRRAAERAAALTAQLLAFSRMQRLEPRVLDLNRVVEEIRSMLRRLIGEHIVLTTELEPELGAVLADPVQMQQVVLNLVLNARDAMPQGGQLTLRTRTLDVAPDDNGEFPPGRWVVLSVLDTGVGMDDATRAHMFEPFYTTKAVGEGTGLGLAMVYGFVKQSGGELRVESVPQQGSQFHIALPRALGVAPPPPADARTRADVTRGSGTILLVEDNESVRVMLLRSLAMAGYTVLTAPDGRAALEHIERHTGTLDLLVTDVVMPEMGGPELSRQLRERFPELRVLFVSGYANDDTVLAGLLPGEAYLQKPFTPSMFTIQVREIMTGTR